MILEYEWPHEAAASISHLLRHAAGPLGILVLASTYRDTKEAFRLIDSPLPISPHYDADRVYLGNGYGVEATGIPIGDGTRARGQRADVIVLIDRESIPKEVLEAVVAGYKVR